MLQLHPMKTNQRIGENENEGVSKVGLLSGSLLSFRRRDAEGGFLSVYVILQCTW